MDLPNDATHRGFSDPIALGISPGAAFRIGLRSPVTLTQGAACDVGTPPLEQVDEARCPRPLVMAAGAA